MQFSPEQYPGLSWELCDMRQGGVRKVCSPNSMDVVLDKAFLDAFLSMDHGEVFDLAKETKTLLDSIFEVLKADGVYILFSLCQPDICRELVRDTCSTSSLRRAICFHGHSHRISNINQQQF